MAERLARRAFDEAFGPADITVASAGMRAFDGEPMHENSARVLAECGVTSDRFVSRTVKASTLRDADLVLTADRDQRAACLALEPSAVRRAFTLRQFARFAERASQDGAEGEGMHRLLSAVNATRHTAPPGEDDLADPVGQPIEAFRTCAADIWSALRTIVAATR
ncbi:low molecular weight phosphatase family protein [Actinoplanes sp. NBRC 103695]|uniref:arsenate reductase/protein-tyrosine-phosphatase family protein n=1 Tax=Actinoplanes sp. NBRC 103695 TaxID=3032202 RepID=UPI0025559953|nr:low molecular weight phosphatase family protein [Actinoplanes sp. NBRC 103695]